MSENRNRLGWYALGSCIGFLWPVCVSTTSLVHVPAIVVRTFQLPSEPPLAVRCLLAGVPDRETISIIPWAQIPP